MTTNRNNSSLQPGLMSDIEKTAKRNLLSVRSDLMHNLPFFGTLSLNLTTAVDYQVRSIATDGVSLKYNPGWVAAATPQQIKSALSACVVSCSFHHHVRRGNRSYGRWQKACNMAITPILMQQGLISHGEGLKISAERAYDRLEEEAKQESEAKGQGQDQQRGQRQNPGQTGSGTQPSPSGAQGPGQPQRSKAQPANGNSPPGTQQPPEQDQQPDDTQQEWDQNDPSGSMGEVQDHPGETEEEIEQAAQHWTELTMKSILVAKQQGLNPGDLAEHISAMLQPTIDWRSALRTLLTEYIRTRSTWARPDRRFAATGPYLAGVEPYGAPPIAFAVDTSGSMSNKELAEVWAEVRECAEVMMPENVRVIQCDAAIADDRTYDPDDLPDNLDARGRGGTMFTPVFDLLEHDWGEVPIGCLIYLTDLYCSDYPSVPPEYPVIWVGSSNANNTDPPFGTRLNIEN